MNFFEHQEKARKQSRWILFAFTGVTLLIVLIIDVLALLIFGVSGQMAELTGPSNEITQPLNLGAVFTWPVIQQNAGLLLVSSAVTASVIGIASLSKIASLKSGGAYVAASLGGTYVNADTNDPLRRRLYNVVEEMSIASGVPVPDVFVLESEPGINAFAAGYSASDAAVAVTQGALEKLSRAELQGVIAHEFSHVFNGDMRINIRLMGVMFGIMVIAILGRKFLHASSFNRSSSSRSAAGGVALGLALMAIGYVGLFFTRWMKSALSRQREVSDQFVAAVFDR